MLLMKVSLTARSVGCLRTVLRIAVDVLNQDGLWRKQEKVHLVSQECQVFNLFW